MNADKEGRLVYDPIVFICVHQWFQMHGIGSHSAFRFSGGVLTGISQPAPAMYGLPTAR